MNNAKKQKHFLIARMAKASKMCISNGWSAVCTSHIRRHDTQHNDIQYNDT
jgi:hypothetical protein